ncbi:MAG TPA: Rho termination factor N-terminal domain-containing protein [Haploplasma sp.]|nr:Rho termination factor N-terminal domain-containing protein [Haploplasma sp.]
MEKTEKPAAKPAVKPAVEKPVVEKAAKPAVVAKEATTNKKVDYNKLTVTQLKDLARELGLSGYSTLRKAELIELLTK